MRGFGQRRKFIGRDQCYVARTAPMNDQRLVCFSNFIAERCEIRARFGIAGLFRHTKYNVQDSSTRCPHLKKALTLPVANRG